MELSENTADMALGSEVQRVEARSFADYFDLLARTSSFFVSKEGHTGTSTEGILPGDTMCVFLGSKLPIVLCPRGDHYTVLGPCYVLCADRLLSRLRKGYVSSRPSSSDDWALDPVVILDRGSYFTLSDMGGV
jgi:hypothetical protein